MDDPIRQEGSIPDYINFAKTLMADDEFKSMEEPRKIEALANYRDAYLDTRNFERSRDIDGVRSLTNTYANLVKQGRLTPTVEDTQQLNIQLPDLSNLSVDTAMERLTEARQQVEDAIPNTFDPVYHEDYKFAYNQWFNEQERSIRGRNTGRLGDLGARFFQGAASRVMTTIGMDTDEFSAKYFAENPDYDDSWWSDLAQGGGDMAATVAVTLAGALLAGPVGGAAAGLYTNGIGKYTEAYKTTFNATGNHLMAHDAGVGALPGAVLETVGDSMLVGRMTKSVPKSVKEELRGAASLADKRAIVAKHLKDVSFQRNVARGILEQSATEAVTEVSGSYVSGLGATLASGFEQVPTVGELAREGSLALVLGGAAGAVGGAVETGATLSQLNTLSQGIIGPEFQARSEPKVPKFQASDYSEPQVTQHTDGTESISVINDQQQPQIITPENRDLYNHLRNLLSARAPIDDIATRPPGRKAGEANNINTNMERLAVVETVDSLNQELNALLPARNQLFSQLDSLGLPPEQVELVKVLQDTVTLNLIKNGGDPSAAYSVQATSESRRSESETQEEVAPEEQPNIRSIALGEIDPVAPLSRTENLFHGSSQKGIESFNGITYFSRNKGISEGYADDGAIYEVQIDPGRQLNLWDFDNWVDLVESLEAGGVPQEKVNVIKDEIVKNAFLDEFANKEDKSWDSYKQEAIRRKQAYPEKSEFGISQSWDIDGFDLSATTKEYDEGSNFSNKIGLINALFDAGYDSLGQLEGGYNPAEDAAFIVRDPKRVKIIGDDPDQYATELDIAAPSTADEQPNIELPATTPIQKSQPVDTPDSNPIQQPNVKLALTGATFDSIAGTRVSYEGQSGRVSVAEDGAAVLISDDGTEIILANNAETPIAELADPITLDGAFVNKQGKVITGSLNGDLNSGTFVRQESDEFGDSVVIKDDDTGAEYNLTGDDALTVLMAQRESIGTIKGRPSILGQRSSTLSQQAAQPSSTMAGADILSQRPQQSQGQQDQGTIQFLNEDGSPAPLEAVITEQVPDMQAIIRIFQEGGNVTTLIHEMFHWWHRSGIIAQVLPTEQLVAFEQAAKVEDGVWNVDNYELAARTFEGWLRNPGQNGQINVSPLLQRAFQRLAGFFRDIYRSLRNSPLPWSEVRGRARPNIDPGFRAAFETLFQIGDPMVEGPTQEGQRLPQVNVGYQGDPSLVSGQQEATETQPTATEARGRGTEARGRAAEGTTEAPATEAAANNAATETQPELYEKDDRDKLNIRLIEQTKSRGSSVDAKVIKLFKDIIKLNTGLKQDTKQSGLFWAALDSYVRARKLVPENREEGDYQLITASPKVWTDAEYYDQQGRKIKYKQPFEQGYVSQLADLLTQIKADATTRAEAEYRKNNEKFLEGAPEGMSLIEMQKWVSDKRKEEQSSDETPERRQSIEDETLQLQAKLRTLDVDDLISELGARQNEEVVREYLTFLSDLDVTNQNLSDGQALELQIQLDQIVNNGTLLGLKQLARAKAESALGLLGNQRYRDAFSKWGLGNFLNQTIGYGDAFNDFIRRLSLTSVNFERLAGNDQAKQALRNMFANYQHLIGEKQRAENRWSEFLQSTKNKWWPKLDVNFAQAMHRAGIASKIMQAPSEENQEGKDAFVRQNVTELRKGFQHMIDFGGSKAQSGRLAMNMLDELLVGLDPNTMTQHEFIEQFSKQHPQENGYINDMIEWVEENLKQDAIFISEALYETEFHEFDLYLPTRQNPVDESRYDTTNLDLGDSAMLNNMGDGGFGVMNPVTVDRSQSLKLRKGYVKDGFAFATNLENTLDTSVKALLNDIHTGLERQKLSYLFNQNSNLRPQLEAALGSGTRATHLAQTIRDVVSSDLNHHNPINGIELAINKLKRNLGPGYMSSLHQFISQPMSQWIMHLNRRGAMKTLPLYKEAMKLLTTVDQESELYQSWLLMKDSHLSTRALPQDPHLVKGKQQHDNAFERLGESFLERLGVENTQIHKALNNLKVWDENFKQNVLLGPLRVGDLFSADLIFAAELINKAKQTQGDDLHKLDLTKVSPEEVLESLDVMDESINASRNSRRGALLAHPGAVISLLTVFSGHRLAMATNAGLKFRNLMEMGLSGDAMVEDSVRTLLGTTAQAMAFTAAKAMVVGTVARAAYLMLTPDEDDERHWLYGDLEKQEIQALRKMRDDGLNQTFGQDAFWKATLKDASGNLFWNLSFFGMENFWFGRLDDVVKPNFKQGKEELVKELKARLQTDFDSMTDAQRQDIANQIKVVESTKYVPYSFRNFDEVQLGGAYGLTLEPILEGAELLTDMVVEGPDSSDPIDFLLLGRLLGYSQQDINRFLRTHSKNLKKLNDLRDDDELVNEEMFSDFGF